MKKLSCLLLLLSLTLVTRAQEVISRPTSDSEDLKEVFTIVEQMPEFPGGNEAMMKFIQDSILYPEKSRKDSIEGSVIVKFIIDQQGNVCQPRVLKGVNDELNAEALRIVRKMPKWKPGKQNGQAVNCYFNLQVRFRLDSPKR